MPTPSSSSASPPRACARRSPASACSGPTGTASTSGSSWTAGRGRAFTVGHTHGYGGRRLPPEQPHLPHFGTVIATCEHGEVRCTADGLLVYGLDGPREVAVERGLGRPGHGGTLDTLWAAVREGRGSVHGARWGKGTLEVGLAILRSARERREIALSQQVGVTD